MVSKQSIIEELDAQIVTLEERKEASGERFKQDKENLEAVLQTRTMYDQGTLRIQKQREPKELRNRAYDLLKGVGNPLGYIAIYDILIAMGVEIGGQNPSQNVIAHMSGDSRFKTFGNGNWGLADWPVPDNPVDGTIVISEPILPLAKQTSDVMNVEDRYSPPHS